jgi:hypothetical protein
MKNCANILIEGLIIPIRRRTLLLYKKNRRKWSAVTIKTKTIFIRAQFLLSETPQYN